jgi:hypothetical protein
MTFEDYLTNRLTSALFWQVFELAWRLVRKRQNIQRTKLMGFERVCSGTFRFDNNEQSSFPIGIPSHLSQENRSLETARVAHLLFGLETILRQDLVERPLLRSKKADGPVRQR